MIRKSDAANGCSRGLPMAGRCPKAMKLDWSYIPVCHHQLCAAKERAHFDILESMRIDLHTHSNVSDGTETPAELIAAAAAAGLDVVALTDHDQTTGWAAARAKAAELGIGFVPGMEITCQDSHGISVHLLSYL